MNTQLFAEALSEIDETFVMEAAETAPRRSFRRAWTAGIAVAAVALLLVPAAIAPALLAGESGSGTGGTPPYTGDDIGGGTGGAAGDTPGGSETGGAPMQLSETRSVRGGVITYLSRTETTVSFRFEKTDTSPVWFTLTGRRAGRTYFATTDPSNADMGTPDAVFTFYIDGEAGEFPTAAGTYDVVVDFSSLYALCDTLGPLQSTVASFALE